MSHKWSYANPRTNPFGPAAFTVDWLNSACSCGFKQLSKSPHKSRTFNKSSRVASVKIFWMAVVFGLKAARVGLGACDFCAWGAWGTPPCNNAFICCCICAICCCNCCTSSLLGNTGAPELVLGVNVYGCAILIVNTSSEIVGFVVKRISCCVWFNASTKRYKNSGSTSSLNWRNRSLRPIASPLCFAMRRSLANSNHSSTRRLASFPILKSCCNFSRASSAFVSCKSFTKSIIKSSVRLPDTWIASSSVTLPSPNEIIWSSRLKASRIPPLAHLATTHKASASYSIPSWSRIYAKRSIISCDVIRLKSKRCVREIIVAGILCGSVVARMKMTFWGGSSKVFNSALKAPVESICTSSII